MAFHEAEQLHHQSQQNETCPSQEKPDLDAIQIGTLKSQEETKTQNSTPLQKVLISFERKPNFPQQSFQSTINSYTKSYQIWGNQSESSSSIYRL
jgi:hypothetical protein